MGKMGVSRATARAGLYSLRSRSLAMCHPERNEVKSKDLSQISALTGNNP